MLFDAPSRQAGRPTGRAFDLDFDLRKKGRDYEDENEQTKQRKKFDFHALLFAQILLCSACRVSAPHGFQNRLGGEGARHDALVFAHGDEPLGLIHQALHFEE